MSGWRSNLRSRLSLIAALAALALALIAPSASGRVAYVISDLDDAIWRIDTATNQAIGAPIPVGDHPEALAITPDGSTVYVVAGQGESITAVDTVTNQPTATIQLNGAGEAIAISPNGATAYVGAVDGNEGFVAVVDLRTNQVSPSRIPIGNRVSGVAFTPNGRAVYVADSEQGTIHVIDTQTRQVVGGPIPVGGEPAGLAFTPDGTTAYAADAGNGAVFSIDTQTRQVTTIPIPFEEHIYGVAVAPDGTRAYASGGVAISPIDTQTQQVGTQIFHAGDESEMTIAPDGRTAYISAYPTDSVFVVDLQANRVTGSLAVGDGPWQIAIVPNQSPVASFTARPSQATTRVEFNGNRSTDPDGTVSIFNWGFGDGAVAANAGATTSHAYRRGGRFTASLAVVDNEGCAGAQVFTGRTAYCSGSALSAQAKTVAVAPNRFKFGPLTRNPRKGTAKLRVRVPVAGKLTLASKGVKKAKRGATKAGVIVLAVKPRADLKEALASKGKATARVRVTFRPQGGAAFSKARSIRLALK